MFSESTTIGVEVVIKDFAVMSTGEQIEILSTCKTLWRDLEYSKKGLVENRQILKPEKKPNTNLLYFMRKLKIWEMIFNTNPLLNLLVRTKK